MRLVLNWVLLRAGFLPIVILSGQRRRYLHAIAMADAGDFAAFEALISEALAWSLDLGIRAAGELIELAPEEG